jgi:hypothetical protein
MKKENIQPEPASEEWIEKFKDILSGYDGGINESGTHEDNELLNYVRDLLAKERKAGFEEGKMYYLKNKDE